MTERDDAEFHREWFEMSRLEDVLLWALALNDAIDVCETWQLRSVQIQNRDLRTLTRSDVRTRLMTANSQYRVVWSANHVVTSFNRLRRPSKAKLPPPPDGMFAIIESLRDVMEHWDSERDKPSNLPFSGGRRDLLAAAPEAAPWSTQWSSTEGSTLANALGLATLSGWTSSLVDIGQAELESLHQRLGDFLANVNGSDAK